MLSRKKKYLQIALNSTLEQAQRIINQLPVSDRIILEAGTPLLKEYGAIAISNIRSWWNQRFYSQEINYFIGDKTHNFKDFFSKTSKDRSVGFEEGFLNTYIVADYKAMDRGATEVSIAANAGASAITVLGQAPVETLDILIEQCKTSEIDSIIDMMNVEHPHKVLRKLKKLPTIVMLHRGVDETERANKQLPIHLINKIKGSFDVVIALGGGDTIREVQSAIFNGADIVMVWKEFYEYKDEIAGIAEEFLQKVK